MRRVLIVISDGGDKASRTDVKALLDRARRSDVVIYTMRLFDADSRDRNPDSRNSTMVLERVAQDIRSAYTIGYVATNARRE